MQQPLRAPCGGAPPICGQALLSALPAPSLPAALPAAKAQVFQLVIVLVLSICCLVAFVILAFIKLPPAAPPPIPTTPTQLAPARLHRQLTYLQWSLTLEGSRLVDSKSGGE